MGDTVVMEETITCALNKSPLSLSQERPCDEISAYVGKPQVVINPEPSTMPCLVAQE